MKTIKFTFQRISGVIEVTHAGAFIRWGGASFWSANTTGGLREAVALAILGEMEKKQ